MDADHGYRRPRILHVEDNVMLAKALRRLLSKRGVDSDIVLTFAEAVQALRAKRYDMVLLDLELPDARAEERLPELLGLTDAPIVVLSGIGDDPFRARVLRAGASEFISKDRDTTESPLRPADLLIERVVANVRRAMKDRPWKDPTEEAPLRADPVLGIVLVQGARLERPETRTEFRLLSCLQKHSGEVVSKDHIMKEVWGRRVSTAAIKTQVCRLRGKLGPAGEQIETGPGGWRLRKSSAPPVRRRLRKK